MAGERSHPVYRIGCDVGGTFTDGIIMDEATGKFHVAKVSTTPHDPSVGFMQCVRQLLEGSGAGPGQVSQLFHGTTIATNAIIERQFPRTALITNDGFTDVIEIARQQRAKVYDLQQEKAPVLIPGRWRYGVPGRIDARGNVRRELDLNAIREVAVQLKEQDIESVAICFLHAYVNGAFEERARDVVRDEYPDVYVSLSSEVCSTFREFTRFSTTVINAALVPVVSRYVGNIEEKLATDDYAAPLHIVQSNGGIMPAVAAKESPVNIIESGPAAGVIAATYIGALTGYENLLSFDMGGTTAKAGLVQGGTPEIVAEYEVGATARTGQYEVGAGYPVGLPVVDLVEVGAGGGSIAWVDADGILKVGPQSAGAAPGPVCYQAGGTEPTVTDANLLLGRLNPAYFLGGTMRLDYEAARLAIQQRIAEPLQREPAYSAMGIIEVSNSNMLRALRLVSTMRGYDPRDYALVAFGGAGPLHAVALARELRIPRIIVPPSAGVASALGILVSDLRFDFAQTFQQSTENPDLRGMQDVFADLERKGLHELQRSGPASSPPLVSRSADVRYVGQAYELTVPMPGGDMTAEVIQHVTGAFHERHERTYGHSAADAPTEIVNLRVTVVSLVPKPHLPELPAPHDVRDPIHKEIRQVYFAECGGYVACPIYDRHQLDRGARLTGPAVIEAPDSTVLVNPEFDAVIDQFGNIIVTSR